MFRNYIKLAVRNLRKHKVFSFINIFGLSIGLTCCMLIALYVYHEYNYDTFHEKKNRIYQLGAAHYPVGESATELRSTVPSRMAVTLEQEFPEVEETARLLSLFEDDKTLLQYQVPNGGLKSFYETKGFVADNSLFNILSFNFIEGNAETALTEPNSIVISEAIAKKFFGDEPAVSRSIQVRSNTNGDGEYVITGVYRPNASPSHLDANFLLSPEGGNLEDFFMNSTTMVNNNMFYTYLLLKEGADEENLKKKFPGFVERYMAEDLKQRGMAAALYLTNVQDIHLRSEIKENVTPPASTTYLNILIAIAVLTLLIACINFMNLSTARSSKKSREVGVRKVLGAEKAMLIRQFLGESVVMALLAFIFALLFVRLLLPVFENVAGKEISLAFDQQVQLYLLFFLMAIVTGLLAGSYPAFFLSSFKPVRVLKGRFSNSLAVTSLRKGLVVFQFVISVVLIVASVVIANQMEFLRSKDLGFIKDQQLIIPLRSEGAKSNYPALKADLERNSGVRSAGASFYYPGIFNPTDWMLYKEGNTMENAEQVFINRVDDTFLETLGIEPVTGRMFSREFTADTTNNIILNEKGIQKLGFAGPKAAVGQWVAFDWEGQQYRFNVIGVVEDFHFKDLHMEIEPYGFLLNISNNQNYLIAHLAGGDISGQLNAIEQSWNKLNPNEPFEYSFLDQDFQSNYEAENRLAKMIGYFTLIAILISCLGLFGLATFSAEQRIREIGLRKVLGASSADLVALLSKDFLKLVLLAIIVASPLAWYIMSQWLQTFAYQVGISWTVFAITALLAVLIALFTVSFQAIKAALVNPVKNLRTE